MQSLSSRAAVGVTLQQAEPTHSGKLNFKRRDVSLPRMSDDGRCRWSISGMCKGLGNQTGLWAWQDAIVVQREKRACN